MTTSKKTVQIIPTVSQGAGNVLFHSVHETKDGKFVSISLPFQMEPIVLEKLPDSIELIQDDSGEVLISLSDLPHALEILSKARFSIAVTETVALEFCN